jgi:hypothetical protein
MTHLYIDIETIPAQRPDVLAEIKATKEAELAESIAAVKPPGTYKKQETIDEWVKTEQPKVIQALRDACEADIDATYRKTSFDGAFGNVCVIGWAFDDDKAQTVSGRDELYLFAEFFEAIQARKFNLFETCVIGHNVAAFDLRFLMQRHIVKGVKPHPVIVRGAQAKPWESDKVFDTMVQWAGIGNRVSLDKLCKALSIPTPKGEIDGSKVWDFVQAGRLQDVAEYCARDVEATRQVHRAMTFQVTT